MNYREKIKELFAWIENETLPVKKGCRDLHGNLIDSPEKVLMLNSTDIERTTDYNALLKTAKSPLDLKPCGVKKTNGFYSRYMNKDGKIYNVFLSKFTNEVLPIDFSEMQDRIILIYGSVSSGKTLLTSTIIIKLENLLNFNSPNRSLSVHPAASSFDWLQKNYHYHEDLHRFRNGDLPAPTGANERLQQYPLKVESRFDGTIKKKIIKLVDLPGEYNGEVEEQLPSQADCLWFLLDGENFLCNPAKTTEAILELEHLYEVFPILKAVPTYVILTKTDIIKKALQTGCYSDQLKVFLNTNESFDFPDETILNSACTRSMHVPAFNEDAYKKNRLFTCKLFKIFYPSLYTTLKNQYVKFISVSSLAGPATPNGKIPIGNIPYAVDELVLSTLEDFDLY